ncbi:MAG: hypothetical protein COT73_00295 [Bdellovibrio sp. CG10_big_fil_rev_8_21_14_0_10_47_8]|nr:MAG: hypothetical protein COT73_00295 [Bdellovibrio sp. CG10_big_fil_rev_8_21_14_0_10_47_8]
MTLQEKWLVIQRYKFLILGISLVAMLGAGVFLSFRQNLWEAIVTFQIGQIWNPNNGNGPASAQLIESPTNVVLKMTSSSFASEAFQQIQPPPNDPRAENLYLGSLKISSTKSLDLLEIKTSATSPELAHDLVLAQFGHIEKQHSALFDRHVRRLKSQEELLAASIQQIEASLEKIKKAFDQKAQGGGTADLIHFLVLQNKVQDLKKLKRDSLLLEDQLDSRHTYTTRLIGDVIVSEKSLSRKSLIFIVMFLVLSIFGSICLAFILNYFKTCWNEKS